MPVQQSVDRGGHGRLALVHARVAAAPRQPHDDVVGVPARTPPPGSRAFATRRRTARAPLWRPRVDDRTLTRPSGSQQRRSRSCARRLQDGRPLGAARQGRRPQALGPIEDAGGPLFEEPRRPHWRSTPSPGPARAATATTPRASCWSWSVGEPVGFAHVAGGGRARAPRAGVRAPRRAMRQGVGTALVRAAMGRPATWATTGSRSRRTAICRGTAPSTPAWASRRPSTARRSGAASPGGAATGSTGTAPRVVMSVALAPSADGTRVTRVTACPP